MATRLNVRVTRNMFDCLCITVRRALTDRAQKLFTYIKNNVISKLELSCNAYRDVLTLNFYPDLFQQLKSKTVLRIKKKFNCCAVLRMHSGRFCKQVITQPIANGMQRAHRLVFEPHTDFGITKSVPYMINRLCPSNTNIPQLPVN